MQGFYLTSNIASLHGEGARVVEIPVELADKDTLLSWYAAALGMPEYFGGNWDAFDEILRDLSWINEYRLILYHRDVPLKAGSKDQKTYIDVLKRAVQDWRPGEAHEIVVAFDPACELRLRAVSRMTPVVRVG